ncbi:hypothetical protein [Sphingobacterium sp.]|uniref:hypothetical protein n=1 Tax=Sphingobacterium sp. TaxID=341027 RepID=UPI0031D4261D
MKSNLILYGLFGLLMVSCNTTNRVTEINYSVKDGSTQYFNRVKEEISQSDAFVQEGSSPTLKVVNFNPLDMTITVSQGANTSSYMQSGNSILTNFLKLDAVNPSNLVNKGFGETGPGYNLGMDMDIKDLKNTVKMVDSFLESYNSFYNSIIEYDRVYKSFLYPKYIDSVQFCQRIDISVQKILTNFEEIDTTSCNCPSKGSLFLQYPEIGERIKFQHGQYNDYLKTAIPSLEENIAKLEKYEAPTEDAKNTLLVSKAKLQELKELSAKYDKELAQNVNDIIDSKLKTLVDLNFNKKYNAFNINETDDFKVEIKIDHPHAMTEKQLTKSFSLPVHKYIKIDYSTGILFSGIYDQDSRKVIDSVAGDEKWYRSEITDGGKLSFGAMGSINFHTQNNNWFNYGASLAAGLMFNQDAKLIISPNVIAIFGKNQRIILHAGLAIGRVDRVYSIYGDKRFNDGDYNPEKKTETSKSWFLGLSWNLTKN